MPTIYGIDVSKYQKTIDWKKVKAAGKEFAFIRLGWAGWEGNISLDEMAVSNIKAAKAAGVHVGIYVYSYCRTPAAAKHAAQNAIALIKPHAPIAYPIAFDIEDTSASGTPYQTYGKSKNSGIVKAFLDEIERERYYGLVYTYKSFAEHYLDMAALKEYDVWIAQYASQCTYKGPFGIWQYAGETGRCDGVATACDLNVAYKDYAAIIKAAGLNGYSGGRGGVMDERDALLREIEEIQKKVAALESEKAVYTERVRLLEARLAKIPRHLTV